MLSRLARSTQISQNLRTTFKSHFQQPLPVIQTLQFHAAAPKREEAKEINSDAILKRITVENEHFLKVFHQNNKANYPAYFLLASAFLSSPLVLNTEEWLIVASFVSFATTLYYETNDYMDEVVKAEEAEYERKVNTAYDLAIRAEEAGLELFKEQSFVVEDVKALTEAVVNSVEDLKYLAKREEIHRFRNEIVSLLDLALNKQLQEQEDLSSRALNIAEEATRAAFAGSAGKALRDKAMDFAVSLVNKEVKEHDADPVVSTFIQAYENAEKAVFEGSTMTAEEKKREVDSLNNLLRQNDLEVYIDIVHPSHLSGKD